MTRLLFLFIAILNYSGIKAQHSNPEQQNISQNLLFHFNSKSCNAGDSLQFKCYIINRVDHLQDDNNLYIILSDKNGRFISRDKYPVINSGAYGSIPIPKELESGTYNIEAFTPYLINNKTVKVNQVFVNNALQAGASELLHKIYYNNNRLVSRIPNTFFVKTEYANGVPASLDGIIVDKDNKEQSRFFTDLNGVGKVTFVPQKNQVYSVKINSNNRMYNFPLPQPDSNGIIMFVSYDSNIVKYRIIKNYKMPASQDLFTVQASQKNNEVYTSRISFDNYQVVTGGFNVENLHTGILKLSLLNNDAVAVSSTSIYLQNDNDFEQVQASLSAINKNGKSYVDLSFPEKANRFFSVSVENMDSLNASAAENPDLDFFYTNALNNREAPEIVEYYTLNQAGKKPFTGSYKILSPNKRILLNKETGTIKTLDDEYATIIRGKVYDSKSQKLFTKGTLNIFYEEPDSTFNYTVKVRPDGSFILDSLIFWGTKNFYYSYYNPDGKEQGCTIKLITNTNNEILDSLLTSNFNYDGKTEIVSDVKDNAKPKLMEEVKIQSTGKTKAQNVNDLFTSGVYAGPSRDFIDNINDPPGDGAMPGNEFIKNRIVNLAFQNGNLVNTRNFSLQTGDFWIVGILIDQNPVSLDHLNALNTRDIALVKFFDAGHPSAGSQYPGGLLAVYTKGNVSNNSLNKLKEGVFMKGNEQVFEYDGFSNNVYTTLEKYDFRNKKQSVYWNPSVILGKDKNNFSFEMKAPEPGEVYKVSVKGYNEHGQLINFETVLKN